MIESDPLKTQRDVAQTVMPELSAAGFEDAHQVGRGGFGVVYRCLQPTLDRTVAVKVLTTELDEENRARFFREQRAMGRLTGHPNIVEVLQVGATESGHPYLVMPYHPQGSLEARIKRHGALPLDEVLRLGVKMAGSLETAHHLDILHRDVKPGNILFTEYGEPVLTDFGIAHISGGFETATGVITGSPAFTAPEVLSGESPSVASDIYGLGATLFCALTGHAAFERRSGERMVAQFLRITTQPVPNLREQGIPEDMAAAIEGAMSADPHARPVSVAQFGDILREIQLSIGLPVAEMALRGEQGATRRQSPPHSRVSGMTSALPRPTRSPGNLPEELTPFVGRRRELSEVRKLLVHTRVLTLIGTGGVGKTRLALAVAADRQRAFPDGVWYVTLDGIEEDKLLVTHVSDVLGHWFDTREGDPAESLARSLRDKHLLLILDNCEQLIEDSANLVDAITRACPKIRILATSRTPLRAAGDVTYQVPPLWMPQPSASSSEKDLDTCDAVRFFMDRARGALSDFEITAENRASVYELVRRLDRLPLAIELAAVRLRSLTVQQITERIESHRTMLNWGSRSGPFRQQTMRSSLQWSAELCTAEERQLWGRLSIFRGTFDLDAVEAVCSDISSSDDILDLLQGLAERSIISREDHGAVVRYSMLEVIRHFGREMLDEQNDDTAALRTRHTSWFLSLVARADAEWNTERQAYWLHVLPLEHKNIVHALSAASGDPETVDAAAEAVCGLWRYYWWACGWVTEGIYWVDHCSQLLTSPVMRARLLLLGSLLSWTSEDGTAGAAMLEQGKSAAEQSGDRLSLALAEHVIGDAAMYRGESKVAVEHFRRALSTYDAGTTSYRVDTLLMLTLASAALGDVEGAEAAHLETLFILAPAERFQRSYSLLYMGEALRRHRSFNEALTAVREALRLKAELDDPFGVAWTIEILAEIACDTRQNERAASLLGAADRLWRSMSIDVATLERLQISEGLTRDRLQSALGPAAFAAHYRRGERLDQEAAIAVALQDEAAPGVPSTQPGVLTPRESEIAQLVARGFTNKQIASKLVISPRTADSHVQNILTKLGFNSRAQIATWIADDDL
ncbi:protein kinase (plasmid) [Rhodococcus opacus]|uniref:protein kinase domain-containing protein n=1 Tax=Rhodococcus opacus TaxID=37919 RepID=UPI0034D191DC